MNIDAKLFIRNIKLSKLGIGELDSHEARIYDFLTSNLSELNTYVSDRNLDDLYFGKDMDSLLLKYEGKKERLIVQCSGCWDFFKKEMNIYHFDIMSIFKYWAEYQMGIKPKYVIQTFIWEDLPYDNIP